MKKRLTTEEFIEKSYTIHGKNYDYSLVDYKNNHTKVKIICQTHGIFEQRPTNHLTGQKCPKCSTKIGHKKQSYSNDVFVKKANMIHNNRYDYSLIDYKTHKNKITILCKTHGEFEQIPSSHLSGKGCPKCGVINSHIKQSHNKVIFIDKSNDVHNFRYDYSNVNYINSHVRVKILCNQHGEFSQLPYLHVKGFGCPICKSSKNELNVQNFLIQKNINYIKEKRFDQCRNILPLPFDFYLPDHNVCIECDGIQHYKPIEYFGGLDSFNKRVKLDEIKSKFCLDNDIKLIRIHYGNKDLDSLLSFLFTRYL